MDFETLLRELDRLPEQMTGAERAAAYQAGEEVDHIPYCSPGGGETLAPLYGYHVQQYRSDIKIQCRVMEELHREFGNPISACAKMGLKGVGEAVGSTVTYPENAIDYVTDYILKDYDRLPTLTYDVQRNPFLQDRLKNVRELKRYFGDAIPVGVNIAGPLSASAAIRKPETLLRDMRRHKEELHALLDFAVECSLKWVACAKHEFGQVSVGIADPVSSYTLISDRLFREFSKPHLKDLVDDTKELTGSLPSLHICGRSKPIWQDLKEIGIRNFSVDNCEDLEELKEAVGDTMSISGNVPPVDVMLNGTIDDVVESVRQCLLKGSDNPSGYTLDVGCQLPIGTPRQNVYAYIYAARYYGRDARKGHLCGGLRSQ